MFQLGSNALGWKPYIPFCSYLPDFPFLLTLQNPNVPFLHFHFFFGFYYFLRGRGRKIWALTMQSTEKQAKALETLKHKSLTEAFHS